jgi:predicted DNA-binding protein
MTTSLRLEARLKKRVVAAARRAGVSPHAFMLDVIEQRLDQLDDEAHFQRLADERWGEYEKSRKAIPAAEARRHLMALARRERTTSPKARRVKAKRP